MRSTKWTTIALTTIRIRYLVISAEKKELGKNVNVIWLAHE